MPFVHQLHTLNVLVLVVSLQFGKLMYYVTNIFLTNAHKDFKTLMYADHCSRVISNIFTTVIHLTGQNLENLVIIHRPIGRLSC